MFAYIYTYNYTYVCIICVYIYYIMFSRRRVRRPVESFPPTAWPRGTLSSRCLPEGKRHSFTFGDHCPHRLESTR